MLLSQKSASLAALAFSTLHHASAAPTQSLTSKHLAARAEPKVYMALGDSYASGIAAGDYINPDKTSQDWQCSRFTNAYPRLLNSMLPDSQDRTLGHFACSGATCEDVTNNQHFTSQNTVDLITVTAGGNNVGFSTIIDRCVYGFSNILPFQPTCDQALSTSEGLIDDHSKLWNSLWNTIYNILQNPKVQENPSLRLMVTNYPEFWNAATDQCDTATFNVWVTQDADSYRMTKDLRGRMNDLSTKMNAIILDVVQNFNNNNEKRVHYVDIDSYFEGHRFCETEYNEPWAYINDEPDGRPDQWIYQLGTPLGNLQDNDTSAFVGTDETVYAQAFQSALKANNSTLKAEDAPLSGFVSADDDFTSGGLPLVLSKLFHPTSNGHQAIAQAISDSIDQLIRDSPSPGDILKGPTTFHQGLGPGGAENDLPIPAGCFVTVPADNTIPTVYQIADPTKECSSS